MHCQHLFKWKVEDLLAEAALLNAAMDGKQAPLFVGKELPPAWVTVRAGLARAQVAFYFMRVQGINETYSDVMHCIAPLFVPGAEIVPLVPEILNKYPSQFLSLDLAALNRTIQMNLETMSALAKHFTVTGDTGDVAFKIDIVNLDGPPTSVHGFYVAVSPLFLKVLRCLAVCLDGLTSWLQLDDASFDIKSLLAGNTSMLDLAKFLIITHPI